MPSPPPPYNFLVIPTVASRTPLWEDRLLTAEHRSSLRVGMPLDHEKEVAGTSGLDAQPEVILKMPEGFDTPAPLCIGAHACLCGSACSALVARRRLRDRRIRTDARMDVAARENRAAGGAAAMSQVIGQPATVTHR